VTAAADRLRLARERLATIVGPERVVVDEAALRPYAEDYTELPAHLPDAVVRVASAEQVAPILAVAAELGVPVVPALARSNVGGLCIPVAGGIVLDLMGLDRILEVHEADRYMVIEPGVTWQKVKDHLDAHHPGLRFGYSLSPPDTSVLGNLLMDGLSNLSLRWGSMSDWINALEVVLPSGRTVRTGAWAWGQPGVTSAPMPRLDGLFVNWHGTTGVVVRAAVEVQASLAHRRRCFYLGRGIEASFRFINALARADLCDDVAGLTWPLGKMLLGEARPTWRSSAEPEVIVFIDLSADDAEVFEAKQRAIERLAASFRRDGEPLDGPLPLEQIVAIDPRFAKLADWPMRLDFLLDHPGGGLTWVGTYGPTSRWPEAVRACHDLMLARGWPPAVVTRAMRGGHFGVLRMIALFDRRDRAEVEAVATLNRDLADVAFRFGYIPYKTPRWVVDRFRERLDPGFVELMEGARRLVDPRGVLNPGRWVFDFEG
jgi:FAD/FMN-containing dehydrogenase